MTKAVGFRERATKGFAWNYLYKFTEFGLMNLYTILVVRHFGPEISAPYSIFLALCTSTSIFASFAVDGVLLRYIQRIASNDPVHSDDILDVEKFALRPFLKTLFTFRVIVLILISLLIIIAFVFLPSIFPSIEKSLGSIREFFPYLILFLFAQSIVAFCTLSLIGLLETRSVFYASLISRSVLTAVGVLAVSQGWLSLQYAIIFYTVSAVLNGLFLTIALSKEIEKQESYVSKKRRRFPFGAIVKNVRAMIMHPKQIRLFLATPLMIFGITAWGSEVLSGILGKQPDILMMGAILGEHSAQIGYYSAASIILLVTEYIFLLGLGGTLVSIFSKLAHDDEKETGGTGYPRLARARIEIAGFQNVVLLPLCAFMMFFAPDVIRSLYGSKFDEAIPLIRIGLTSLALSIGIFSGGMQITSLASIGKPKLVFRSRLFWGITNLTANFFLIQSFGAMGAIIGSQFSNAFACGTEGYFAGKIIGNAFDPLATLRIMLISATSGFIAYFIILNLGFEKEWIFNTVVGGIICAALTMLFYYILKVPEAHAVWKRLQAFLRQQNPLSLQE